MSQSSVQSYDDENIGAIKRAHQRMRTLIEDALAVAREGEQAVELEPVLLDSLVTSSALNGAASLHRNTG